MTKILITGGFGFIGASLISQLNKDFSDEELIIDVLETESSVQTRWPLIVNNLKYKINSIYIYGQDDGWEHNDYDYVIHLGANSSTGLSLTDDNKPWETNVLLTERIANYCSKQYNKKASITGHRGPYLIFASSASVYGNTFDRTDAANKERDVLEPLNDYALTKIEAENRIKNLYDKHLIMRFFNVYGKLEGLKHPSSQSPIYRWFYSPTDLHSNGIEVGDDNNHKMGRDFVSVDLIAHLISRILKNRTHLFCQTINVGSGHFTTWKDLGEVIAEKTSRIVEKSDILDILGCPLKSAKYQFATKADVSELRRFYHKNSLGDQADLDKFLVSPTEYLGLTEAAGNANV